MSLVGPDLGPAAICTFCACFLFLMNITIEAFVQDLCRHHTQFVCAVLLDLVGFMS